MTITVTADILLRIAGKRAHQQAIIIPAIAPLITNWAPQFGVTSALRLAHFLGQTCEESDGFATMHEYASGAEYEGRKDLGNVHAGDGIRYKGAGLIETTGRANYRDLTKWVRDLDIGLVNPPDFEAHPEQLLDPSWGTLSAFWFWQKHGCNALANMDDSTALTKRINGGLNGFKDRVLFTNRAKNILIVSPDARPILFRGESGADVLAWQRYLVAAGFPCQIDGNFGPATESVTKAFQRARGLTADGVVGAATRAA